MLTKPLHYAKYTACYKCREPPPQPTPVSSIALLAAHYNRILACHCFISLGLHRRWSASASTIQHSERGIISSTQRPFIIPSQASRRFFIPRNASPTMQVAIRPIAPADEERWRTLWEGYNQFYKRTIPEAVTSDNLSRFLNNEVPLYCAVAVVSGGSGSGKTTQSDASEEVAGFVTWFPHLSTASIEPVVYLNDLFVDPNQRNSGIGGQLIEHVYKHSKDVLRATSVYWHTQHFNHRGQLLYVKKGTKTDFVQYEKVL